MTTHQALWAIWFAIAVGISSPASLQGQTPEQQAATLFKTHDFQGGLIVHLGSGEGGLTAAMAGRGHVVLGLDADASSVEKARKAHHQRDDYGLFSFDVWQSEQLPVIDNTVNLIVVEPQAQLAEAEALRVLAPNGKCIFLGGSAPARVIDKPRPADIDDWTHYLHDASGNAVAHDQVVGPPRHLQWLGHPRWSRHHDRMASMSALVSSAGKLFYIMDEGSRVSIQLPADWQLIAQDAFNGVELWRQPIKDWQSHLWPLKSGPTQLARRLVSTDKHVFVTLGFEAPLSQIDAVSGKILREYEGTKSTEEVLHLNGMLLVQVNEGPSPLTKYAPQHNVGDQRRVASEFVWNGGPRWLKAIDSESGKTLWSKETTIVPLSLCASDDWVLFHTGKELTCLSREAGEQLWSMDAPRRDAIANHFGPKIVIHDGVVLYTGGNRNLVALEGKSGKQLWTAPKPPSAYQSPEDLLVVGGLVWTAPTTGSRDSGIFVGRDPKTGEVKQEFAPNVETYWFHHRCYIAKATDRFLIPSRTGIEFVDFNKQDWNINHWVRGGCLYGVLPANGLLYAPPHNCACYPEAKLFGFNALAPHNASRLPSDEPANTLTRGPAFGKVAAEANDPRDWPTFRHDNLRSGSSPHGIQGKLETAWTVNLGGRLSALVSAAGRVYVAQIDQHTLHALDAGDGSKQWSFTAGGRIDSPPSVDNGRVFFGCADGNVYCLRATDGELVWKFQAAPADRRLIAFGQIESVWPVHGSVLVQEDQVFFVAGRSNFLDGGLWWFKLQADNGAIVSRQRITDRDPSNGKDLQDKLQILQMPVGLPDILSGDGKRIFMRSQAFDLDGNRQGIGPISGQPAEHASVQQGETAHLFAPMGFLDGTWFHRAYWVYGRNFAGGHNGYYQAGKFAPSGRILVSDENKVYGFGRKPEYLRWTTTLEHQLFAADKTQSAPPPGAVKGNRGGPQKSNASMVRIANAKHLDPTGQPLTISAWVKSERVNGVVVARGGPQDGFALHLANGRPAFSVRNAGELQTARSDQRITGRWAHLAGVLNGEGKLTLYVDGRSVASAKSAGLIKVNPKQPMEVGADDAGAVGTYQSPAALTGMVDEVRLYFEALTDADIQSLASDKPDVETAPALSLSFDSGDATDRSTHQHHGLIQNAKTAAGKYGHGLQLSGPGKRRGGNSQQQPSYVKRDWAMDLPIFARAMTLAGDSLLICGPPDVMDEEATFQQLVAQDKQVEPVLQQQQEALDGKHGSVLLIVSKDKGVKQQIVNLKALPAWDGMISAAGKVYLANVKGQVQCLAPAKK